MNNKEQSRDFAVSMFQQGKSPAEVWERLAASGMDRGAAEALVKELVELRRQTGGAPPQADRMYTVPAAQTIEWNEADKGDFLKGLMSGLFCGCWAILVVLWSSRTMGSDTKNGVYVGFLLNLIIGVIWTLSRRH